MNWPFSYNLTTDDNGGLPTFGAPTGDTTGYQRVAWPGWWYNFRANDSYLPFRILAPWTGVSTITLTLVFDIETFHSGGSSATISDTLVFTFAADGTKAPNDTDDDNKFHYIDHFASTRVAHLANRGGSDPYALVGTGETLSVGGVPYAYTGRVDTFDDEFSTDDLVRGSATLAPPGRYEIIANWADPTVPSGLDPAETQAYLLATLLSAFDTPGAGEQADMNNPATVGGTLVDSIPNVGGTYWNRSIEWELTFT